MEVSKKLHNQDYARRLQFANFVVNQMTEADLNNAVFSDKVDSSLVGELDTQNIRGQIVGGIRAKPSEYLRTKSKFPQKVMLFLNLHSAGNS